MQTGSVLTGEIEGGGGGFGSGGELGTPITDGKVNGDKVSFKSGNGAYAGTIKGDTIELTKTIDLGWLRRMMAQPAQPTGERPAVGPAPDGSDPSFDRPKMSGPPTVSLVLQRAPR
jgi:beta-galactosidase